MINPIIVVEDNRKMARMVKAYLEGAGFRVVHFEKGKEAIEAALKELPLLVILDLKLPDISGEEVCQELKEIGDFPIIMLTSKYDDIRINNIKERKWFFEAEIRDKKNKLIDVVIVDKRTGRIRSIY